MVTALGLQQSPYFTTRCVRGFVFALLLVSVDVCVCVCAQVRATAAATDCSGPLIDTTRLLHPAALCSSVDTKQVEERASEGGEYLRFITCAVVHLSAAQFYRQKEFSRPLKYTEISPIVN